MEESKAAAYYDELTRKGEGAARFKQGLGFTSNDDNNNNNNNANAPIKGSALPSSSSSFLSSFVKASTPNATDSEIQHQSELHNIKNKLKKKPNSERNQPRVSDRDNKTSNSRDRDRNKERHSSRRSRSRSRSRDRGSRHVNRSSSRDRYRDRDRDRDGDRRRRKRRSRSRSDSDEERERRRGRKRSRSRSLSPQRGGRKSEWNGGGGDKDKGVGKGGKEKNGKVDYSRLIEGYDKMTPAERVKAKMKLQLSETVEKDAINGMGSGWERFEFNKDAPLDDEEVEAVEDDAALVKHIGQSFRFSAVEARNEEQIKSAHDNAMFGVPALSTSVTTDNELEKEDNKSENHKSDVTSLVSEKVIAKQQGSWRDRVRKV